MSANVRDHGAAGDGVADDTAAFAAAVAAGGIAYVPVGTYKLTGPIMGSVIGDGPGSVLRQDADQPVIQLGSGGVARGLRLLGGPGANSRGVLAGPGVSGLTLSDLLIEGCDKGVFLNTPSDVRLAGIRVLTDRSTLGAIDIAGCSRVSLEGCVVDTPATHGIDARVGSQWVRMTDCHVRNAGNTAYVLSTAHRSTVAGCTAEGGQYGLIIENGALHCSVSALVLEGMSFDGILVALGTGTSPVNTSIGQVVIRGAGQHGVFVSDGKYVSLNGVRVSVFGSDGIRIGAGLSHTVTGCIVTDGSATSGAAYRGYAASSGVATGNVARNNAGAAFMLDPSWLQGSNLVL